MLARVAADREIHLVKMLNPEFRLAVNKIFGARHLLH
jgi:hypothetical protein